MKSLIQTPDTNEYIRQFSELIQQGKECWIRAGKILADAVERVPNFIKKLSEKHPDFNERFLRKMLDLGRGALHVDLLIGESDGERRLAKLSYSWQEKYSAEPVALLIKTDKGWDQLNVEVKNLSPEQCNQVFADNHVRNQEQQRSYLENIWARKTAPPVKINLPYRVVGRKLIVMHPTQFEKQDLLKILAEIA